MLALLTERPRHGYDLEQEISRRNIRLWAKIGASTVYKTLQDLKRDGYVSSESAAPTRGAGREVFTITTKGEDRLSDLVATAFRSDASLYSDRIVAMAFSAPIPADRVSRGISGSLWGTGQELKKLAAARLGTEHRMAHVIIDFYTDLMIAERKALTTTAQILGLELESCEGEEG